jgi:hypothetical protein
MPGTRTLSGHCPQVVRRGLRATVGVVATGLRTTAGKSRLRCTMSRNCWTGEPRFPESAAKSKMSRLSMGIYRAIERLNILAQGGSDTQGPRPPGAVLPVAHFLPARSGSGSLFR